MTNPPNTEGLTDNRLEGEFYYATWDDDPDYSDGTFEIHRQSDGKEIVKWFHGDDGARPDAESALKAFDAEARRLIDTERERAKAAENQLRELASLASTAWPIKTGVTPAESRTAHDEITRRLCAIDDSIAAQESNQEGAG